MENKIEKIKRKISHDATKFSLVISLTKIISLFILNKIIAVILGPAGIVAAGQIQNIAQIFAGAASGSISAGITKYISDVREDTKQVASIYWASFMIFALFSFLVLVITVLFYDQSYLKVLSDSLGFDTRLYFLVGTLFTVFVMYLTAILNGLLNYKLLMVIILISTATSLVVFPFVGWIFDKKWVFKYLILYQFAAAAVFYFATRRMAMAFVRNFDLFSSLNDVKKLVPYSLMGIVAAVTAPTIMSFIRSELIYDLGILSASVWEANMRISSSYMVIVTTTISMAYLPRFSTVKTRLEAKRLIKDAVIVMSTLYAAGAIFLFVAADKVISIVLTSEFHESGQYVGLQLISDYFKMLSQILSFFLLSQVRVKSFLIIELLTAALMFAITSKMIAVYGVVGAFYSNLIVALFSLFIASSIIKLEYKWINQQSRV